MKQMKKLPKAVPGKVPTLNREAEQNEKLRVDRRVTKGWGLRQSKQSAA